MQLLKELKTLRSMDERLPCSGSAASTGSSGSAAASSAAAAGPAAADSEVLDADMSRDIPASSFRARFQIAAADALAKANEVALMGATECHWEKMYHARWAACSAMAQRGEIEEQLTI